MRYRASNGVTGVVELTEAETREHYEQAAHVDGEFGGVFVVCPIGEMGHVLTVAATTYEPIDPPGGGELGIADRGARGRG